MWKPPFCKEMPLSKCPQPISKWGRDISNSKNISRILHETGLTSQLIEPVLSCKRSNNGEHSTHQLQAARVCTAVKLVWSSAGKSVQSGFLYTSSNYYIKTLEKKFSAYNATYVRCESAINDNKKSTDWKIRLKTHLPKSAKKAIIKCSTTSEYVAKLLESISWNTRINVRNKLRRSFYTMTGKIAKLLTHTANSNKPTEKILWKYLIRIVGQC